MATSSRWRRRRKEIYVTRRMEIVELLEKNRQIDPKFVEETEQAMVRFQKMGLERRGFGIVQPEDRPLRRVRGKAPHIVRLQQDL